MTNYLNKVRCVDHKRNRLFHRRPLYLAAGIFILVSSLLAQPPPKDLTQASLEDLMNVQVTSVSKKEQKLSRIGAAVFVITQEDIRRSGSTNIPDILRMVPGVNVARIDAHTWSVSVRGFNDLYGNKVLVMVDGRPLYRQSFSGVRWDEGNVPLENIERIEVIRGPGGTVWGANAVNGVINIITKSAWDTQGGLISTAVGSEVLPNATVQFGGAGRGGAYRIFGGFSNTRTLDAPALNGSRDPTRAAHAGFRIEYRVQEFVAQTDRFDGFDVGLRAAAKRPQFAQQEQRGDQHDQHRRRKAQQHLPAQRYPAPEARRPWPAAGGLDQRFVDRRLARVGHCFHACRRRNRQPSV